MLLPFILVKLVVIMLSVVALILFFVVCCDLCSIDTWAKNFNCLHILNKYLRLLREGTRRNYSHWKCRWRDCRIFYFTEFRLRKLHCCQMWACQTLSPIFLINKKLFHQIRLIFCTGKHLFGVSKQCSWAGIFPRKEGGYKCWQV